MMRSLKLITTLLFSVVLSSCSTVEIPDINTYVTLPVSGDGHGISTLSRKQVRIPRKEWDQMKRKGIVMFSEDWEKLRYTILKNCLTNDCKQSVGALDTLFRAIDDALAATQK